MANATLRYQEFRRQKAEGRRQKAEGRRQKVNIFPQSPATCSLFFDFWLDFSLYLPITPKIT